MSGTLRTFDIAVRQGLIERMHTLLAGLCAAHGASYRLELSDYAPPVVNDPAATIPLRAAAEVTLGQANVADGPMLMVAEDMAEYLTRVPGSFFVLGAMPDGLAWAEPHHSPRFDVDERALPLGVAILAETASAYLHRKNP
jgi:metal-dependent amidase/aminoacylase/carboxypeptidase family protein